MCIVLMMMIVINYSYYIYTVGNRLLGSPFIHYININRYYILYSMSISTGLPVALKYTLILLLSHDSPLFCCRCFDLFTS